MTQGNWQDNLTASVAGEVRRYREARGMSAQQLADECKRRGFAISRSALANLENNRRESITLAEVLILATALEVPPALLIFPLGQRRSVEVTPGELADPLAAILWFSGQDRDYPGTAAEKGTPLDLFMLHRRTVIAMLGRLPLLHNSRSLRGKDTGALGDPPYPPLPDEVDLEQELAFHASVLQTARDAIRKLGLTPPALPPVLAYVDPEETADGSR